MTEQTFQQRTEINADLLERNVSSKKNKNKNKTIAQNAE